MSLFRSLLVFAAPVAFSVDIPTIEIAPGVLLPAIILGGVNKTQQPDYPDYSNYTLWLELGGRGFDTAWEYNTQVAVAQAVIASGIPREQIFITTKIPGSIHGGCCPCHGVCFPTAGNYSSDDARAYVAEDLRQLGEAIGYIDLLLLHEPCDYLAPYPYNASKETAGVYLAMEEAYEAGHAKAIGVSNFDVGMLQSLFQTNHIRPVVNQYRASVGSWDTQVFDFCSKHNITFQAYSPLHSPAVGSATLEAIATAHGKSQQEVLMRWITQKGAALVTASEETSYDLSDMDVFTFELTDKEMSALESWAPTSGCKENDHCADLDPKDCLDKGCKTCPKAEGGGCGSCGCIACCDVCQEHSKSGTTYCQAPGDGFFF